MIVVMKPGSTPQHVERVVNLVREMGLKDHVIVGTERTVVAVIGDDRFKDRTRLESVDPGWIPGCVTPGDASHTRRGRMNHAYGISPGLSAD